MASKSGEINFIDAKHKKLLRKIKLQDIYGFNLLVISYFFNLDAIKLVSDFSNDGRFLVIGIHYGEIKLIDTKSMRVIKTHTS